MDSGLIWKGDKVLNAADKATVKGMLLTMSDCVQTSKDLCPVDYGTLQGSIELRRPVKRGAVYWGEWGSFNVNYALWVEIGTGPHFPPLRQLEVWAERNLGDRRLGFAIALAISKHGTKAQPYLRPSADEHYPELAGNIKRSMK